MSYGMIPQAVIDEVLSRHEIADVVGKYVHLSKNGKYLKGLCPFHSEKTPSFTVTPEKGIFHCYGCGKGGNAIKFIMEMEGESFPEAVKQLADEAGIQADWAPVQEAQQQQQGRRVFYEAHAHSARLYHYVLLNIEAAKPAMAYLRSRGFTDAMIEEFQLGYAPARWDTLTNALDRKGFEASEMEEAGLLSRRQDGEGYVDKFRDRIIFPIADTKGQIIAFAGRSMGDAQPKYLNSPESPTFNKSRTLYRLHEARSAIRRMRQAVLFEGYADCIKAWSAGVHNGLATMGTALTAEHAALLKRYADEIILCYDGDDAGQAATHKSIPLLEGAGFTVRVGLLPNRTDPDEYIGAYGPDAFMREIIEGAVSAIKFQLIYLRKSHILLQEDGRIRYLRDAVKLVARRDSPTERELLLKELAKEFEVSIDTLKQETLEVRKQENLGTVGDIPGGTWNNVWNDGRSSSKPPAIAEPHIIAERQLLSWSLQDKDIAQQVQERLGTHFVNEDHAAIAAYLYAFYAQGNDPDVGRFMMLLQDEQLMRTTSAIAFIESPYSERALDDCIRMIGRESLIRDKRRLAEEQNQAQRAGDLMRAAQIGIEIITLEKQLKQF